MTNHSRSTGRAMATRVTMTLLVFLALCANVVQVHVVAQQTQNNQNGGTAPTRYPSSELSEAITASSPSSFPSSSSSSSSGGCDCKCDVVKADGTKAKAEALLDGDGDAQLSCSACCKSSELLKEMSEHLPVSLRNFLHPPTTSTSCER